MTDKVTTLFPGTQITQDEPVPEVVSLLEDMLARAKTGELRTAAIACATSDGCILTGYVVQDSLFTTMGALAYLSRRVCELAGD